MAESKFVIVPEDGDPDWDPPGYKHGPDNPGPVTHVHDHGEGKKNLEHRPDPGEGP